MLDGFAQVADRRFLTLSGECVAWLDDNTKELQTLQDQFVEKNRLGVLQISLPKNNKPSKTNHSTQPSNTVSNQTSFLIDELAKQSGIEHIAAQLSLSKMTIINQLSNLLDFGKIKPDDVAYLSPDDVILEKVKTAVVDLSQKGELDKPIKIKPIFDELREEYNHQTIALALLFLKDIV